MENRECTSKELLTVVDEIPRIFKIRDQGSMFKSTLLQDLDKHLSFKKDFMIKALDTVLEKYPSFLHKVEHRSGLILQIQKKHYGDIRRELDRKATAEISSQKLY